MNKENIGIYIHVPFCAKKCPYCDFYTTQFNKDVAQKYTKAIIRNMKAYENKYVADTLFFGGGTPSLLTYDICKIVNVAKEIFTLNNAEITIEVNPRTVNDNLLSAFLDCGINRISFGVQSLNENELKTLGRNHTPLDPINEIEKAKSIGFENISADLMLGIPHQTKQSVISSINSLIKSGVTHISAYMLQIEENTPFYENGVEKICPSEEETAELYLTAVEELNKNGFYQYEISNFAKPNFESKHNLKYWEQKEYLGFGASAHSFIDNTRFAVTSSVNELIENEFQKTYITDEQAGTKEEYEMLSLRLSKGLKKEVIAQKYGDDEWQRLCKNAKSIKPEYINVTNEKISLTPNGFLVSNDLIAKIIF